MYQIIFYAFLSCLDNRLHSSLHILQAFFTGTLNLIMVANVQQILEPILLVFTNSCFHKTTVWYS